MIIDEAQNLTPKQMKTLITRAGPGTKIVCLGNIAQIDTPYLTEGTSGLTYVGRPLQGLAALRATSRWRAASARGWRISRPKFFKIQIVSWHLEAAGRAFRVRLFYESASLAEQHLAHELQVIYQEFLPRPHARATIRDIVRH